MAERIRKQKTTSKQEDVEKEIPKTDSKEELKEELDDLLDEIDSVLEENAEDFVKSYVQKGDNNYRIIDLISFNVCYTLPMALYGKRERYDVAQKLIENGTWVVDPQEGTISSKRFKSIQNMGTVRDGYNRVAVPCSDGVYRYVSAHRVIWETVYGESDLNLTINHKDGDTLNNSIENLELISNEENTFHGHRTLKRGNGSRNKGSINPKSKLNENQVKIIKNRLQAGENYKTIAIDYNVAATTIYSIKRGDNWSHV